MVCSSSISLFACLSSSMRSFVLALRENGGRIGGKTGFIDEKPRSCDVRPGARSCRAPGRSSAGLLFNIDDSAVACLGNAGRRSGVSIGDVAVLSTISRIVSRSSSGLLSSRDISRARWTSWFEVKRRKAFERDEVTKRSELFGNTPSAKQRVYNAQFMGIYA